MDLHTIGDLRYVFRLAIEQGRVHPADLADHTPRINSRYARELIALLAAKDLGTYLDPDVPTEFAPYHWDTPEEAMAVFNESFGVAASTPNTEVTPQPKTKSPRRVRVTGTNKCFCGCGLLVTNAYRPGHDARHASAVAWQLFTNKMPVAEFNATLKALPTPALRAKARSQFERMVAVDAAKKKSQSS